MELKQLSKDERVLINRRAYELAMATWGMYRTKLAEEALCIKGANRDRPLRAEDLASVTPDICAELRGER